MFQRGTIERTTNQIVTLKKARLAQYQVSEKLKIDAEVSKIKKEQTKIELNTLHTTTRINKLREQNVRVIDVITAAMRAKEEINKILASQVTLNQVNDITMEYNLDVSNHNFRKNIVDTDAQKTKANIHSDANAKKVVKKSAAVKDSYTQYNSNINFDGSDVTVLTWMEFVEEFLIKRNLIKKKSNISLDTFTPISVGGL